MNVKKNRRKKVVAKQHDVRLSVCVYLTLCVCTSVLLCVSLAAHLSYSVCVCAFVHLS